MVMSGIPNPDAWPSAGLQPVQNQAADVMNENMHEAAFVKGMHANMRNYPLSHPTASASLPSQKGWGPLVYVAIEMKACGLFRSRDNKL